MVSRKWFPLVVMGWVSAGCGSPPAALDSDTAIHLEDQLDAAEIESASLSVAALDEVEWRFDEGESSSWKPMQIPVGGERRNPSQLVAVDGALRLSVSEEGRSGLLTLGGLYTELDDWDFDDWESIVVQARTADPVSSMVVALELDDGLLTESSAAQLAGILEATPVFSNGDVQTYVFPVTAPEPTPGEEEGTGAEQEQPRWRHLGVAFGALRASSIDIVSVRVVPSGGTFREPFGVRSEAREHSVRKTLFAHTPARLRYRVQVPPAGRLDFDLGVVRSDVPVTFKATVASGAPGAEDEQVVFQEDYADPLRWNKVSVDLSEHAGAAITLSLRADAPREGTVALWGAPTLSGAPRSAKPNVIFYVIDGGGADFMSVYGYNRRTTPFMERLAEEGAVFEHAYSNSTWTQSSTASFMTSLHHSVLGGLNRGAYSSPVPTSAKTLADHLQGGGYLTASFTTNPNAARLIGVEQGMDVLVEHLSGLGEEVAPSSTVLHDEFWRFREQYPAQPYAVHFQTTDVHWPYHPEPPFAGLYATQEEREELAGWERAMFGRGFTITSVVAAYRRALERENIDRLSFYQRHRDLYDETMAQQDYHLHELVERLKAAGEWERTLLIIGADHGHPAGSFSRFGRGMLDPEPPEWEGALFDSFNTRIPLIVVWPGGIAGGQRFRQPVSMIDVLPTVLDLVGLPQPEILQGQSLAPLLRGEDGWEPRPVIFDEFRVDPESGEWIGNLEMIDGRWGASLEIGPPPEDADNADPNLGRHAVPAGGRWGATHPYFPNVPRLLLYDLSTDPHATHHVNDRYPELVESYRDRLQSLWEAHQALGKQFGSAEDVALTPEQLRQLRALGYIQ